MLTEKARVLALEDDCLWVDARRKQSCGNCTCGRVLLAGREQVEGTRIRVLARHPRQLKKVEIGDEISIGITDTFVYKASMFFYLLPLAGLLVGVIMGSVLSQMLAQGQGELPVIFSGLSGLVAGLYLVGLISRHFGENPDFQAVLLTFESDCSSARHDQ